MLSQLRTWAAPVVGTSTAGTVVFWAVAGSAAYLATRAVFSARGDGQGATTDGGSGGAKEEEKKDDGPPLPPHETKDMTLEELALYDGTHAEVLNRVYLAAKGTIFDVTAKPEFYGPGAGYNVFAGKDASYGLAKTSLDEVTGDLSTLSMSERDTLDQWYNLFTDKYHIVGKVIE